MIHWLIMCNQNFFIEEDFILSLKKKTKNKNFDFL